MKRREGGNTSASPCFIWSNSSAPAMALPVQLPSCPWSYTGGQPERRSTLGGSWATWTKGAEYILSRWSGRSGTQPKRLILRCTIWPEPPAAAFLPAVLRGDFLADADLSRSEERRVGKECSDRRWSDDVERNDKECR